MKIIIHEKNEMIPLNNEENKTHENKKNTIYVKKNFVRTKVMRKSFKKCKKSEIIVITQGNIEELLIVFVIYIIKY